MRYLGICTVLVASAVVQLFSPQASAQTMLETVTKRGELICGVNGKLPGFSSQDDKQEWRGFEVDMCRAIAAGVLGDAKKVRFVPLTTTERFDALRSGKIDVMPRNTVITMERTVGAGVRAAAVYYIDGQAVVVSRKLNVSKLGELNNGTICTLRNSPYPSGLADWFGRNNLTVKIELYDNQDALYQALYNGTCGAVSQDMSAVASTIIANGKAADYLVVPELVATHPLAVWVKAGDDGWFDIARWTVFALLHGEELGITKENAASQRTSGNPAVRRLLGVEQAYGKPFKLDEKWAFNVLSQVGNYSEIYERNVGSQSILKFARGVNALWVQGGAMYPWPLR